MNGTGDALATVERWIGVAIGLLVAALAVVVDILHTALSRMGVPGNVQSLVILLVALLFAVGIFRAFGGLLRVLLVLFLVLLALHILLPGAGF